MTLTSLQALARATGALVSQHDLADVLATMLMDVCTSLGAAAAGLLVVARDGDLEVMSASSHRALDLELYQVQGRHGPCVDAISTRESVVATGRPAIERRWPHLAQEGAAADYHGVQAHPLRWHGEVLGALNIYYGTDRSITDDDVLLGQSFADIATLLLLTRQDLSTHEISVRVDEALASRAVIEFAKGVLMHTERLTSEAAYVELLRRARELGTDLTDISARIVRRAHES